MKKHGLAEDKGQQAQETEGVTTPKGKNNQGLTVLNGRGVKSPSDTTLYAPTLKKTPDRILNIGFGREMNERDMRPLEPTKNADVTDQISNFVENIRLEQQTTEPQPGTSGVNKQKPDYLKDLAAKFILEAEKFNTEVARPKGMVELNETEIPVQNGHNQNRHFQGVRVTSNREVLDDDEFFHITCHVDHNLTAKIERGEFVDPDKLLIKDRFRKRSDDDRLQFVSHEGYTYLAPVHEKETKVTGIQKWDQPFRVYAAIYSKANPHRSAEIWQYVHIINTAASNYIWENVAYYDFTFRQMMAQNSHRSWAKTFNQLWNLAICTPLQKNYGGSGYNTNFGQSKQLQFQNGGNRKGHGKKKRACWKFNKNQPCPSESCWFNHKCSYCGSFAHTVIDCPKLKKKQQNYGNASGGAAGNRQSMPGGKN